MSRKKKIAERIEIDQIVTEGKGIGRLDGKVYIIDNAIPGDVVKAKLRRNKADYAQGFVLELLEPSADRIDAFCDHFEDCGGCKWQFLSYEKQLSYKEQIVNDTLKRLSKIDVPESEPILGAEPNRFYRNKMEYSFSHQRWLTKEEAASTEEITATPAVGFHVPRFFDKIVDIKKCWLQDEKGDQIRNAVRDYALENNISFFNIRKQEGLLRSLILRNNKAGDFMVVLSFYQNDPQIITAMMRFLKEQFSFIKSLHFVVNSKGNDTLYDQDIQCVNGNPFIEEQLGELRFRISPKSFFQTNSYQALKLYEKVKTYADCKGDEVLYDLYCGTGTIGLFLADSCKEVIGIETVGQAVADAKINAEINKIENAHFYEGEIRNVIASTVQKHGKADVVILDPPRAGLHKDVCTFLNEFKAPKMVYVSCNPATQARDLQLLAESYTVKKVQAVDMFPHTYHIESVVLLELKNEVN